MEEILKVEGLDAVIIGPYDLSASMGITGYFENKEFINTMKIIMDLSKKWDIPFGDHIVIPDQNLLEKRIQQGYSFIAFGTDGVFLNNSGKAPKVD